MVSSRVGWFYRPYDLEWLTRRTLLSSLTNVEFANESHGLRLTSIFVAVEDGDNVASEKMAADMHTVQVFLRKMDAIDPNTLFAESLHVRLELWHRRPIFLFLDHFLNAKGMEDENESPLRDTNVKQVGIFVCVLWVAAPLRTPVVDVEQLAFA